MLLVPRVIRNQFWCYWVESKGNEESRELSDLHFVTWMSVWMEGHALMRKCTLAISLEFKSHSADTGIIVTCMATVSSFTGFHNFGSGYLWLSLACLPQALSLILSQLCFHFTPNSQGRWPSPRVWAWSGFLPTGEFFPTPVAPCLLWRFLFWLWKVLWNTCKCDLVLYKLKLIDWLTVWTSDTAPTCQNIHSTNTSHVISKSVRN